MGCENPRVTPLTAFAGRSVALFGLGSSGLDAARALLAGGADVAAWDDKQASRDKAAAAGIAIVDLHAADWSAFSALVLAPGVPLTHPTPHWTVPLAQAAHVEIFGDIELFCRERAKIAPSAPFVAITGTNGKSTTTALTAHLFTSFGSRGCDGRQYRHADPAAAAALARRASTSSSARRFKSTSHRP